MKPRLEDVAARAGVSITTVSRVLNDKPGVRPDTRRVVLTALDVLGYDRPSRLTAREAGLVGLVVPELENPFFVRFAQVIETELVRAGYTPVLCSQSLGGIHEDDYVTSLLEHGVAGIIFVSGIHAVSGTDPERYTRLTDRGVPIVLVNGFLDAVPAAFVSNDDQVSVDLAVAHLANMGHRRIGLALGQRRYVPVGRRIEAFRAAMRTHVDPGMDDAAVDEWISSTVFTPEGGATAGQALIEQGATGIVCGSDLMALGVIQAARRLGLSVPRDVSVVGSDDSFVVRFTDPPLTTVRQPAERMGAATVWALLEQIGGRAVPAREVRFPPELVVRASTARAPLSEATEGTP